jgi:hypothetical protein
MVKCYKILDGVTATTSTGALSIKGVQRLVLVCKRADNAGGTSTFAATVSAKDQKGNSVGNITYSKWISNATNTNAQGLTRVASLAIANDDATGFLTMDPDDAFESMIVTVTETADGTHSAWLICDYADTKEI